MANLDGGIVLQLLDRLPTVPRLPVGRLRRPKGGALLEVGSEFCSAASCCQVRSSTRQAHGRPGLATALEAAGNIPRRDGTGWQPKSRSATQMDDRCWFSDGERGGVVRRGA